jgi:bacteriocin biosynthesis cyclodehydratase domain-containing protein
MAPTVHLIGFGAFGEAVADQLADNLNHTVRFPVERLADAVSSRPERLIVALWRPAPSLCEAIDALCFEHRLPWLPIIMEHPVIRVGPDVSPGRGPCFRCYRWRRTQHDVQAESTEALYRAYDVDPTCGPAGFLPHHARLSAALAGAALDFGLPGDVSTIGPVTGQVSTYHVLACHACDRCEPARLDRDRELVEITRTVLGERKHVFH